MSPKSVTQENVDVEKNVGVESDRRRTKIQDGHNPRSMEQATPDITPHLQSAHVAETSAAATAGAKNPASLTKVSLPARSHPAASRSSFDSEENVMQSLRATSRTLSLGQSREPPVSSAEAVPDNEAARDRQRRLNDYDERLYNLLLANQSDKDSLRALFVTEDSLTFVRSAALTEFYDFFNLQACNIVNLRKDTCGLV